MPSFFDKISFYLCSLSLLVVDKGYLKYPYQVLPVDNPVQSVSRTGICFS